MNKKDNTSVSKGFAILTAASIAVKLLSLLYIPFLLGIIGDIGNGIYAASYQIFVFVYVLANAGIPVALSKIVSELCALDNKKDALRVFKISRFYLLIIGFMLSLAMALLSHPLARLINYERAHLAILALSPSILLTSAASSYRGYFQGLGNMRPTAVSQVLEQVINTLSTLALAALFLPRGLEAACAGGAFGTTLGSLAAVLYLIFRYEKSKALIIEASGASPKSIARHSYKYEKSKALITEASGANPKSIARHSYKELLRKIIYYAVPVTASTGLHYAGYVVDVANTKSRLLFSGFTEDQATELYSHLYKYQQLINVPNAFIVALAMTVLPAVSAAIASKNERLVSNRMKYAFKTCFMVSIPAAAGLSLLAQPVFNFLQYRNGWELLGLGAYVLIISSAVQIENSVLQGAGKMYRVTLNLFAGIVVKLLVNYFLIAIPSFNVKGAIAGSLAGFSVPLVLNGILLSKLPGAKVKVLKYLVKPAISSGFMSLSAFAVYKLLHFLLSGIFSGYLLNAVSLLPAIITGLLTYIIVMSYIRGFSEEDLEMLPGFIYKKISGKVRDFIIQS